MMVVLCVLLFKPSPKFSYDTKRHQLRRDCLPTSYLLLGSLYSTFNPLSPSIHIQILQTDLHTFP